MTDQQRDLAVAALKRLGQADNAARAIVAELDEQRAEAIAAAGPDNPQAVQVILDDLSDEKAKRGEYFVPPTEPEIADA